MTVPGPNFPSHAAVVVTSIAAPNKALCELARGCISHDLKFYVIGDVPSPPDFRLEGCDFYGIARQRLTGLRLAELLPERHYARKNLGYLLAIREGATRIIETDDDNHPLQQFWAARSRRVRAAALSSAGWVNVYDYFSESGVWPRGLPLDAIRHRAPSFDMLPVLDRDCPIQQGLADDNPDVDAIYRLTSPLPLSFRTDRHVALGTGAWCPFNSQNTTWFADAYALLYLPSYCSFRMTDIWRSFVAQRIAWENGWSVLFHEPTVVQERNDHDLMHDFRDEVPGYLHNRRIGDALGSLSLRSGGEHLGENLRRCYEAMIQLGLIDQRELGLVDAWTEDIASLSA